VEEAKLVLEYLKAILSTPVVVGTVCFVILFAFKNEIGRLIDGSQK
jgi:hypothetical protein